MSGIAGIVAVAGDATVAPDALQAMAAAIRHRGPDEAAFHIEPRIGIAQRTLHTVPSSPQQHSLSNEAGSLVIAIQGRMFGTPELDKGSLEHGHRVRTMPEAELVGRLWDHGPGMFEHLQGPFALALWDRRQRCLVLARDRVGVAPMYWARQGPWFLFGSEIKAILASGLVAAQPDLFGIDHIFTFMGLPGARTCFKDINALLPGHYLRLSLDDGPAACPVVQQYWDLDFPDRGQEQMLASAEQGADQLQEILTRAVARRMRPGEPVASYISGGIDCSTMVALAGQLRGTPLPTFTVRMESPRLDETERTRRVAHACGSEPVTLSCNAGTMQQAFPRLMQVTEHPLMDASCATLLLLAQSVREHGYRVVLAGDGADDLFAGYPWFRVDRLLRLLDVVPGIQPSSWIRRLILRINAPHLSWERAKRLQAMVGGHNPWLDVYGLVGLSRSRFYSESMRAALEDRLAYEDLTFPLERMRRWHPLHRGLYFGTKMHVPGLLLHAKGDRLALHSGVEIRYPYLDEEVIAFASRLHPSWKLHYLRDKYLLRHVAARWLPRDIAWRPKRDFLAPLDSLYGENAPAFIGQLLSEESLRRSGYFDPAAVAHWRQHYSGLRRWGGFRISIEMGLAGVAATQLWHHTFLDPNLADLPGWSPPGAERPLEPVWNGREES